LNRQNATAAARLRQKERKMEKYAHDVRTYPLAAHAVRMAFWRFKKRSFFSRTAVAIFLKALTREFLYKP
jgi:hypothetical protein